MKTLNILYQSDDNYAIFMGVSITSLLKNCPHLHLNIYVIDIGISEDNKIKLRNLVENYHQKIIYLDASPLIEYIHTTPIGQYIGFRKNTNSFCKLFFADLLNMDIEEILYIDCDTIIVNDLSGILDIDMSNYSVGMVQDSLISVEMKQILHFGRMDKYYNSGVILFNIKRWKECNCAERILAHASEGFVYGTVDQDYLNVVLKNEIKTLNIKYNFQLPHFTFSIKTFSRVFRENPSYYSETEIENGLKNPVIIHFLRFCGESPWHKNSIHPATKLFDKYLAISPWKDYKKIPSSKGWLFKIEKILFRIMPRPFFFRIYMFAHNHMVENSNTKISKKR